MYDLALTPSELLSRLLDYSAVPKVPKTYVAALHILICRIC